LLPALAIGFALGTVLVCHLHDDNYRKMVIVLTFVGSVFVLLRYYLSVSRLGTNS
jgi:hypothetical protein